MKTIEDLQKMVGCTHKSVTYGQSRTVLNNLETPVLAYGVGWAGFVCVYADQNGFPKGAGFSVKRAGQYYCDGGFYSMDVDEVLELIKNNELFADTEVDVKSLESARNKKVFVRPFVGKLVLNKTKKNKHSWNPEVIKLSISKYKNGNYCVESDKKEWCYRIRNVRELFLALKEDYALSEDGVSKEEWECMKSQVIAEAL